MTMENDLVERHRVALEKISAIRDSIIGAQTVNWSEHIYPLVAALGEAGFEGAGYEISRANVGTLIDNLKIAETRIQTLEAELVLEKLHKEAAQRSLEHDRTRVIDLVNAISDEFERRSWLMSSRGSYEWDDERFQQEFADAVEAMRPHVAAMRKIGGDWSNCPMSGAQVTAARLDLEAELARKTEALTYAHKGLDMVHNGLMDPTRPRQAVGEVCFHFLDAARAALTEQS